MTQRRDLNALLNDGFSATDSPRALMSLLPMDASFAQDGIKPQRIVRRYLLPSSSAVMEHICVEGEMFQEGAKSNSLDRLKCSINFFGFSFRAKRPHMIVNASVPRCQRQYCLAPQQIFPCHQT